MYKLLLMAFVACMAVNDRPLEPNTYTREPILCIAPKTFGRCSGDAYCTACSNCSACKHCSKEGGSCGVCATYKTPAKPKPAKRTTTNKPAKQTPAKPAKAEPVKAPEAPQQTTTPKPEKQATDPATYTDRQKLEVTANAVNVYRGPGTDTEVVITLSKGDPLTFISYEGEWIYVYVTGKQRNGWINYKYVK